MALTKAKELKKLPPHIAITMNIFEVADACRRENNALRSILHKQGLSDVAIQNRVKRLLKNPDLDETGAQLLKRVCEESLKRFQEIDLEEWLSKVEIRGRRQ